MSLRMKFKAVLFDIGGVLIPQPQIAILEYEKLLKLPTGFLGKVFMDGAPDNSFCKLERGELLFTDFIPKFEAEVKATAKREGVDASKFTTENLFSKMMSGRESVHKEMFHAVKLLKNQNVKTCALTNNWIDDREETKQMTSKFSVSLRRFFDVVVESCIERIRKPDTEIYKIACERLGIKPSEAVFLDDIGSNLKSASELGIKCIKVVKPMDAIKELEKVTGLDLTSGRTSEVVYPPPVNPNDVPHSTAVLKSGMKIHYVEVGNGPVVMLFHGFPELWFSWRYQIPALANAGYRVIAMDQRGFGDSDSPPEINEYTQKKICQDAIDLMDCLGIGQATVVGHDWGGAVVWNLGLFYSHRLKGVCGITTPLFTGEGAKKIQAKPETFDYQMYFQAPGVAEKEFENDILRTFKLFFRGPNDDRLPFPDGKPFPRDTTNVTKRGGMFVGYPEEIPIGKLVDDKELEYYVQQYKKTGFRGPLNWYRNHKESMGWQLQYADRKVVVPSLMITASHDFVLKPEFSLGMEERIPNLSRVDLKNCSHWAPIDKHEEVNDALISWLDKIHQSVSKL